MSWLWGGKEKEKDPLVDMKLEDYLAKYPTLKKGEYIEPVLPPIEDPIDIKIRGKKKEVEEIDERIERRLKEVEEMKKINLFYKIKKEKERKDIIENQSQEQEQKEKRICELRLKKEKRIKEIDDVLRKKEEELQELKKQKENEQKELEKINLEIGSIIITCDNLISKISGYKPLLSSKLKELMSNQTDYDEYVDLLSKISNIYTLCNKEIKLTESVCIIESDEAGIVVEILQDGKYKIKLNNGNVIKRSKSEIIQNTL